MLKLINLISNPSVYPICKRVAFFHNFNTHVAKTWLTSPMIRGKYMYEGLIVPHFIDLSMFTFALQNIVCLPVFFPKNLTDTNTNSMIFF